MGIRNVRERVGVLYGGAAAVEMVRRPGRGTRVTLRMPVRDAGTGLGRRGSDRRMLHTC